MRKRSTRASYRVASLPTRQLALTGARKLARGVAGPDSRTMEIFLIRHAQAVDKGAPVEDGHRPLTRRGRRDARKLGKVLLKKGVGLQAIVTSPLVRAVETAELVAVSLEFDDELDVAPELRPQI